MPRARSPPKALTNVSDKPDIPTHRKKHTMFRKAIAVTGIAAGLLAAGAGAAFAQTPPPATAGLALNASVTTTISLALSTTTKDVTLTPGAMSIFPGATDPAEFLVETATNDGAGYTDTVSLPSGPLTAGNSTISEANTAALVWTNPATLAGGYTAFNGVQPITLWTNPGPSGSFPAGTPGSGILFSQAGSDDLNSNLQVTTPANQPGGTYAATFLYSAIAN